MKEKKQELKPIWLHCLKELFDEAEGQSYKKISALNIQHKAKKKFPGGNYMRFRAICYAMKSIFENGRDEKIGGKFNSSTYTVKYKLPRKNPIKTEPITDIKYISNNSARTGDNGQKDKEKREIKKPSKEEVQKYLNKWDKLENYPLQEKALNKLFNKTYPKNENIEDVLIKVCSLNAFYSTNILSLPKIAEHIVKLDIDNSIKNDELDIVNKIASVNVGNKERIFYSFATKYCSHHKPDVFPIYDDYVSKMLVHFNKVYKFYDKTPDLRNYHDFTDVLSKFKSHFDLDCFSLKEIDRYLWLTGKEFFLKKNYKKKNK
jgi:hypothetical protein